MKKIYIIILNYNGYEDTHKCLKSLPKLKAAGYSVETVIVDNGSTDGSVSKLQSLQSKVQIDKIIESGGNIGFAKGNNVGIRYALDHGADYVLLLNNDTWIDENFLPSILSYDVDIISSVVKFREFADSEKWIFDYGGKVDWWTGRTTHINKSEFATVGKGNTPLIEVDYIAGCCMLIKRKVFEDIGLLPEEYFIYFEDVDFCVTAKKAGYGVFVDPKTFIYHKLGGSMDRWSTRAIYRNLTGNFIFITRHLGIRSLVGYTYLAVLTAKIVKDRLSKKIVKKLKI